MKQTKRIEVNSYTEAWEIVKEIAGTNLGFVRDSSFTDYPIYRSEADGSWVSDLNTRLELNLANGKTINIWFSDLALKLTQKDAEIAKLEKKIKEQDELMDYLASKANELEHENEELKQRISGFEEIMKDMAKVLKVLNQYA